MATKDKLSKNTQIILDNKNLNASVLYEKSKALGIGIRKTDFLKLVRDIRKLPEPTKEQKEKHIPTKYKNKPKAVFVQKVYINKEIKKKTQYAIAEIETYQDEMEKQTYWIKYKNKKDFNRQLDILLRNYKIQSYDVINHGVHYYKPFIDTGFQTKLDEWHIKV